MINNGMSPREQAMLVLGKNDNDLVNERTMSMHSIFFKPNTEMVKWLIEYANGRLIIDAGCGEKFLLSQQLIINGAKKVCAIDPYLDYNEFTKFKITSHVNLLDISFHPLVGNMERYKAFLQMDKEILLIFARPCHSDWVEETLNWKSDKVEALYITLPENMNRYDDLGIWKDKAVLLEHKGSSADKEVVYSIK